MFRFIDAHTHAISKNYNPKYPAIHSRAFPTLKYPGIPVPYLIIYGVIITICDIHIIPAIGSPLAV